MKLNIGCGKNKLEGYVNVDKDIFMQPDQLLDMDWDVWPWDYSSVDEVVMSHVLEHTENFEYVMTEIYRVCKHDAKVLIAVPHARHDDFLGDPTHCTPITYQTFAQLSKKRNKQTQADGYADTPLAEIWGVDFEVIHVEYFLDEPWKTWSLKKEKTDEEINFAIKTYNNVVKKVNFILQVIKE